MPDDLGLRARKKQAAMTHVRVAGLNLVATRSYADICVEDLAHEAGVAPATIYRHFGSKSRIFAWPLAEALSLSTLAALLKGHDLSVALIRLADQYDDRIAADRQLLQLQMDVPELQAQFRGDFAEWSAGLAALLQEGTGFEAGLAAQAAAMAAASAIQISIKAWLSDSTELAFLLENALSGIETHFQF